MTNQPNRTTDCRVCPESRRLVQCLIAIAEANANVPASVLRSVAYDIAMNCLTADVAEFQIERRARNAS